MMFFLLSLIDLLTAFVLVSSNFAPIAWHILLYHGTYLIIKGLYYSGTWLSWIDIIAGAMLMLMIFGFTTPLSYLFAAFFVYKYILYLINH